MKSFASFAVLGLFVLEACSSHTSGSEEPTVADVVARPAVAPGADADAHPVARGEAQRVSLTSALGTSVASARKASTETAAKLSVGRSSRTETCAMRWRAVSRLASTKSLKPCLLLPFSSVQESNPKEWFLMNSELYRLSRSKMCARPSASAASEPGLIGIHWSALAAVKEQRDST